MNPFDVCAVNDPGGAVAAIVFQGELYLDLPVVLAIPLFPFEAKQPEFDLNPIIEIGEIKYRAHIEQLAGVPKSTLGRVIGTAEQYEYVLKNALDRLISGY